MNNRQIQIAEQRIIKKRQIQDTTQIKRTVNIKPTSSQTNKIQLQINYWAIG